MGTAHKIDKIYPALADGEDPELSTVILKRPVVLIVDDDAVVRAAMSRVVALCSMKALEAESGEEALEILAKRRVDVLVCDQSMPKMCGADVLNIASARFPNVGRVLLSGHSHSDLVRSDVDLGDV